MCKQSSPQESLDGHFQTFISVCTLLLLLLCSIHPSNLPSLPLFLPVLSPTTQPSTLHLVFHFAAFQRTWACLSSKWTGCVVVSLCQAESFMMLFLLSMLHSTCPLTKTEKKAFTPQALMAAGSCIYLRLHLCNVLTRCFPLELNK